ncbi:MAG: hypothetical protein ACKORL_12780, partial [Phycisphaerales bacterium]
MPTEFERFPNLRVFDHPLVQHKLSIARVSKRLHTSSTIWPAISSRMRRKSAGVVPRARAIAVETPLETTEGRQLSRPVTL